VSLLVLLVCLSPIFIAISVSRNRRRQRAILSATVDLAVDASGAQRTLADGRTESVAWDEVTEVDVFTTRVGPHEAAGGAVVLYGDDTRGCIIPLDKVGESGLFDHVHRLPDFDFNAFVDALTAAAAGPRTIDRSGPNLLLPRPLQVTTVIWTREPREPTA
jgi:hypothetical protein